MSEPETSLNTLRLVHETTVRLRKEYDLAVAARRDYVKRMSKDGFTLRQMAEVMNLSDMRVGQILKEAKAK